MRLLMTAANAPEAEMICQLLRAAGIEAVAQGGAFAATASALGARDIYVQEEDLAGAREVLAGAQRLTEAELEEGQESAGGETGQQE